jgi:hypothetical protein
MASNGELLPGGILHVFVAFDWGNEVDLEQARRLVPAEAGGLPRRRRTPSSIDYRPRPLRFPLAPIRLELPELGPLDAATEATVFDFGAISLALRVPFRLTDTALTRLAAALAEPHAIVEAARTALEPLYVKLRPAIEEAYLSDLCEEYFLFELPPDEVLSPAELLRGSRRSWLARLLRLEAGPLSDEEADEALRLHLCYGPDDVFVPDWAAAVLVDRDCDQTLEIVEFANLQLLELRFIDNRLDDRLAAAARLIHPLTRTWLPVWRTHARPLRALGDLKIEANDLFERTGNVLKLVGDQYLARVYRLLAERFHLDSWGQSIERKLDVVESIFRVLAEQASTYREELLELTIILLIALDIVLVLSGR